MRTLIVATSTTPSGVANEIKTGRHARIDYIELADRLRSEYRDYNTVHGNRALRWLEERLRLDIRQAIQVAQIVYRKRYDAVLSMSERVGIPLSLLLNRRVKHVVIMHHPLSPNKLSLVKALNLQNRWSAIIAISRSEAEALRSALNLEPGRIKVLNTPVDTAFFKPSENTLISDEKDHVESMGLSHRDYPTLLAAMRLLPHVTCYIRAGSMWVNRKAGYADEIFPGNVRAKPPVPLSVLRDCYAKSRFIIVPVRQTT